MVCAWCAPDRTLIAHWYASSVRLLTRCAPIGMRPEKQGRIPVAHQAHTTRTSPAQLGDYWLHTCMDEKYKTGVLAPFSSFMILHSAAAWPLSHLHIIYKEEEMSKKNKFLWASCTSCAWGGGSDVVFGSGLGSRDASSSANTNPWWQSWSESLGGTSSASWGWNQLCFTSSSWGSPRD